MIAPSSKTNLEQRHCCHGELLLSSAHPGQAERKSLNQHCKAKTQAYPHIARSIPFSNKIDKFTFAQIKC